MRCPTCRADNVAGSFVCHACLRPLPAAEGAEVPMVIPTGSTRARTRFVRQPSEWTVPLQATLATYLLVSAVVSVLALVLVKQQFTQAFVINATLRGTTLSIDQLRSTAEISYGGVLVVTSTLSALKALLAAAGFMRWSWVYILDMVLLAVGAAGTAGTLFIVPSLTTGATLLGGAVVSLVVDVAGLCVLGWMAVALSRYGIWACRKIPVAT